MHKTLRLTLPIALCSLCHASIATTITDAIKDGDPSLSFRYRFADISQDGAKSATANTIRTRLGYKTGDYRKFSSYIEYEQISELFDVDYNDGLNGIDTAKIGDPEIAELNQGYVQYKTDTLQARIGRQKFTIDNKRFIGSAGWRQNERTYDALTLIYTPTEALTLTYGHIDNANPASGINQNANDHLFHAKYKASDAIAVAGYAYFLDFEDEADPQDDIVGANLTGKVNGLSYRLEYAQQDTNSYSAEYFTVQGKYAIDDATSIGIGYDLLGSDGMDGELEIRRGNRHGAQGWADKFTNNPTGGLVNTYINFTAKLGKITGKLAYHNFESDDDTVGAGDLGTEIDASLSTKAGPAKFTAVYANYMADKHSTDTRKIWFLTEVHF